MKRREACASGSLAGAMQAPGGDAAHVKAHDAGVVTPTNTVKRLLRPWAVFWAGSAKPFGASASGLSW